MKGQKRASLSPFVVQLQLIVQRPAKDTEFLERDQGNSVVQPGSAYYYYDGPTFDCGHSGQT